MGINISVYQDDGSSYPGWDFIRYAGDREFYFSEGFEWSYRYDEEFRTDVVKRPADIGEARAWVSGSNDLSDFSKRRLLGLLTLLEEHPGWWISG